MTTFTPLCTSKRGEHRTMSGTLKCPVHRPQRAADGSIAVIPMSTLNSILRGHNWFDAATKPEVDPDVLAELARKDDEQSKVAAAANPSTRVEDIDMLSRDDTQRIRSAAATAPAATPQILARLARDESHFVQWHVASNPNASAATLRMLADSDDIRARESVADNPSCPTQVLVDFAGEGGDRFYRVRMNALSNPKMPAHVLEAAATDANPAMREAVAFNRSCPPEVLAGLAHDPVDDVRICVADNLSTPLDMVTMIARESERDGAVIAMRRVSKDMHERLGVHPDNTDARDILIERPWWTMTPESEDVTLALAMYENP